MTETIASLVGAIVWAIITTSFWFVQHRIEQKDDLNNERRQDKRELVKNIMRNRMNQRALCIDLNQIPLTFYDDPQAKELYRKLLETHDVATRDTILADLVNHLAETMNFDAEIRPSDFSRGLYVEWRITKIIPEHYAPNSNNARVLLRIPDTLVNRVIVKAGERSGQAVIEGDDRVQATASREVLRWENQSSPRCPSC